MIDNINVSRPYFSQEKFQETFSTTGNSQSVASQIRTWKNKYFGCTANKSWNLFVKFFPVFSWLPKYKKNYIVGDLIAGWTVGIIRIPQGMAYALLAGVQPVYGLYSCFFPVLLWFVFSTSKHTSVGTMAVVCLMIQNLISLHIPELVITQESNQVIVNDVAVDMKLVSQRFLMQNKKNVTVLNSDEYIAHLQQQHELDKISLACSATLLVGIIQLAMALFRLGFLTTLLSDPVIQGFTTGAAFHVLTSQVKYVFGLDKSVGKYSGPFALFKTYGDIFRSFPNANVPDLIISLICLPSLLGVKYFSERYRKKLRNIPIPIELLLVVVATMISYFCHLDSSPFNVNIVKTIPTGMPSVSVPSYIHLWSVIVSDCLIMAIISVAISLSLTKIYADKHGYEVDANQEIFALGICNTIPAFLTSFAVAASLSRTAIQESTGGKTQLVSVLSSILMLIVLLWLAPLFEPVPKSVLACIIIVALKSLFFQLENVKDLWSVSKFDLLVWMTTCMSVVVLGVDFGLAVGVAMAIAGLLFRIQHPKHALLGRIIHTDIYADPRKYKDAQELSGIRIFHFADSVSFTNKDAFRTSLYKALGYSPNKALKKMQKNRTIDDTESRQLIPKSQYTTSRFSRKKETAEGVRKRTGCAFREEMSVFDDQSPMNFEVLIFDGTMWSFVDWTAAREIMQIIDKFQELGVTILLAGLSSNVLKTLDGCGLAMSVTHEQVFVSVHDAATHAERTVQAKTKRNDDYYQSYQDMPGYPGYDSLAF